MASDEQLIADLSAALRQALSYLEADAGLQDPNLTIGTIQTLVLDTDVIREFDGDEANRVLKAAAARLAIIQTRRPGLLLPIGEAKAARLSEGLADMLCWSRGFIAGRPDQPDDHPMGVEAVRAVREALRDAIAAARGQEPEEMPF